MIHENDFLSVVHYHLEGDGIAIRGQAYGVKSIRVDGNDALAMYNTVCAARETAIREQKPILIEVMEMRNS